MVKQERHRCRGLVAGYFRLRALHVESKQKVLVQINGSVSIIIANYIQVVYFDIHKGVENW